MLLKISLITLLACALVQARPKYQPSVFEEIENAGKGIGNVSAQGLARLPENFAQAVKDTFTEDLQKFNRVGPDFKKDVGAGLDSVMGSLFFVISTPLRVGLKTTANVG